MSKTNPISLINKKTGNWWADHRKDWCAYCGVALEKGGTRPATATRDHVFPRAHQGRHVTIPSCRCCNQAKANKSLAEFMLTPHFNQARERRLPHQWPLRDLWLVMALAAVEQARSFSDEWPS